MVFKTKAFFWYLEQDLSFLFLFEGIVSVHRQPAFLNLASRSVVSCKLLRPSVGRYNHIGL